MANSAELQQLSQQTAQMVAALNKLVQAQSKAAQEAYKSSKALSDAAYDAQNTSQIEQKIHDRKSKMNKEEQAHYAQYTKNLKRRTELSRIEQQIQEQLVELTRQRIDGEITAQQYADEEKDRLKKLSKIQQKRQENEQSISDAEQILSRAVRGSGKALNAFIGFLTKFGPGALLNFNAKFMAATHRSVGVIEESTGNFDQGMGKWLSTVELYSGMAAADFLGMMAQNRQMVNALGGIEQAYRTAIPTITQFYAMTGDMKIATEQVMKAMTEFAQVGIKPSQRALAKYTEDIWQVAKQTGLSLEQSQQMFESMSHDINMQSILKAAREDEREAILANQRALIRSNIALGMTATQAAEAAKMLNKMVAQKPIERLKQAAKVRALGAAMGMGNEANGAAIAIQHGKLATAEEKMALSNFANSVTGLMDTAARQGMAQEIFATEVLDRLDLEQYFGANSDFSTTLGNVLAKSQGDVAGMYQQATNSVIVPLNQTVDIALQTMKSVMDGTMLLGMILNSTRWLPNFQPMMEMVIANIKDMAFRIADVMPFVDLGPEIAKAQAESAAAASRMWDAAGVALASNTKAKEAETSRVEADGVARSASKTQEEFNAFVEFNKNHIDEMIAAAGKYGKTVSEVAADQYAKIKETAVQGGKAVKDVINEIHTINLDNLKEQKKNTEAIPKPINSTYNPEPTMNKGNNVASFNVPGVGIPSVIRTEPSVKQETDTRANQARTETIMNTQSDLIVEQNTKINDQLKKMDSTNGYLKVIAETNPVLVDLAEKQLAAILMDSDKREKMANSLKTTDGKFNAAYQYAV